ncbi:MAG: GNAT family N-acetyltransferase [Clostridiales bacterium]|nr:GNAT family N-acetyltransferase [Clostridiales bacterium]
MYDIDVSLKGYEVFAMETDRLRLSVYKKSRAKQVTDYLVRNREFHRRWAQTHTDDYFSVYTQKNYLNEDLKEYRAGRLVPLWVTLKDDPDTVIGRVSFFNLAYGGMMSCALGYHQDKETCGHGYMTEAVSESVKMVMKYLRLHRVEAFILPDNEKSIALIKRCGFEDEGYRKSYMHINGSWKDHRSFYILDESFL